MEKTIVASKQPQPQKLLIDKLVIKTDKYGRKANTTKASINYDHWLYHTHHLYNDIAYSKCCRICHLALLNKDSLGRDFNSALWQDVQFYNDAIKSNKRVISTMDRIKLEKEKRSQNVNNNRTGVIKTTPKS